MSASTFDDLTGVYEHLIDWPKRLHHEEPFYRRLFDRHRVRRVADVACGTGHHAAMFASWGLQVAASDLSRAMIQRAERQHGNRPGLTWAVRSFCESIVFEEPFDAVVCVGNSLALVDDMSMVETALCRMAEAVRAGGVIVIHLLNLWRLPDGPCVWQKCVRTQLGNGKIQILKGVHRSGSRGFVDLAVVSLDDSAEWKHESVPLLGIEAETLESAAKQAGMSSVALYGGYEGQAYDRSCSQDLILVASSTGE